MWRINEFFFVWRTWMMSLWMEFWIMCEAHLVLSGLSVDLPQQYQVLFCLVPAIWIKHAYSVTRTQPTKLLLWQCTRLSHIPGIVLLGPSHSNQTCLQRYSNPANQAFVVSKDTSFTNWTVTPRPVGRHVATVVRSQKELISRNLIKNQQGIIVS